MVSECRVVIDTNVIVSAFLFSNALPQQAFDYARFRADFLMSYPVYEELVATLSRGKFERYVDYPTRKQFLDNLPVVVKWVEVATTITACRDPKDNKFLELAMDGDADFLITGDRDLLALADTADEAWRFRIVTPREFLEEREHAG